MIGMIVIVSFVLGVTVGIILTIFMSLEVVGTIEKELFQSEIRDIEIKEKGEYRWISISFSVRCWILH